MSLLKVNMKRLKDIGKRIVATFAAAAIPNIAVGSVIEVSAFKAAVMAGAVAVIGVVEALARAYKDGTLTNAEIDEAFAEG